MLNNIYKYTHLRFDFFDNLLIRATQKYALNDPFELRPSHKNEDDDSDSESFEKLANSSYFDYAVVSLSETNNNLLMWSHYADQHKGIVIEFDANRVLFDDYKDFTALKYDEDLEGEIIDDVENERRENINAGHIQRVRYNSKRPSMQKFENILEHLLIKSDEWIYEKEHRIILPLLTADYIVVHEKHLDSIEFTLYDSSYLDEKSLGNSMFLINIKEILKLEGDRYIRELYEQPYVSEEDAKNSFIESIYREYLKDLSEDPTTVFLYKIHPESIKAIYMGCKILKRDRDRLIKKISLDKNLSHIKIFQSVTSSERFELEFKQLDIHSL
ncbi:DUF2971 family protein [Buttiauxella sp. BIGb0552]|uniref:DUF2971 domain-containing protein n=1 Tax=Buttiauxella sp. BIGb0552 TaxID=2485120 RepID=UPI001065EF5D|nr:DUF2971 domain-containing protein [Buttiauxella sp. BIGb0552]TDX15726.1 DUF2971 family protein [Buttiauxella sp. BIGb0552]